MKNLGLKFGKKIEKKSVYLNKDYYPNLSSDPNEQQKSRFQQS